MQAHVMVTVAVAERALMAAVFIKVECKLNEILKHGSAPGVRKHPVCSVRPCEEKRGSTLNLKIRRVFKSLKLAKK